MPEERRSPAMGSYLAYYSFDTVDLATDLMNPAEPGKRRGQQPG